MIFSRELFFYLSKNYSFICTGLFENLKARFLKSIITWSEMGQQTVQAKEVYYFVHVRATSYERCCHVSDMAVACYLVISANVLQSGYVAGQFVP